MLLIFCQIIHNSPPDRCHNVNPMEWQTKNQLRIKTKELINN